MQDKASLHEKTVQKVASDSLPSLGPRPRKQARVLASYNRNIKVDPRVWKKAMQLAKGEKSRIVVVSSTEVIVK